MAIDRLSSADSLPAEAAEGGFANVPHSGSAIQLAASPPPQGGEGAAAEGARLLAAVVKC